MKHTVPDFHLVAHSHGLALLDGITDWREKFRTSGEHDKRYTATLQGWFNGSFIDTPILAEVIDKNSPLKKIQAWVISIGSGIGGLAFLGSANGKNVLYINEKFTQFLNLWHGSTPIVSMLYGNEYALTMLNRHPAYDFLDSEILEIEKEIPIVDDLFIDQLISSWIDPIFFTLIAILKVGQNQLIHILPPPPREHPERALHFESIEDVVAEHGFLPDRLRLKWYRRYCRQLTQRLEAINCQVLAPPPEACNAVGLLKEEYADGLTHGNGKYGMLVAKQIAATLRRPT